MAPRLIKGFLTVGGWTLVSRVLGFVRDIFVARFLGTSDAAEAFFIAFSLPNLFRRFFAEGAFNMAFVPLYAKKLEAEGEDADAFARDAVAAMVLILTVTSVLGVVLMPVLVLAMASGFAEDARYALAVDYGRIAFPYIMLISLGALVSGVLNSNGRYLAAAAAPALLNAAFITAMLLVAGGLVPDPTSETYGRALIWAVPVGGLLQLATVWWAAHRAGHSLFPRARPRMTPDLKRLLIIAGPALLTGGVVQVNTLVSRQIASYFDGAVAWLNYADRLYQLPLGVVGIAIGVVLLPELSRRVRAGDTAGQQDSYSRAMEFSLLLTIPATVAFLVIPLPLVETLFERGEFNSDDSASTALALMIYALGLPAFVLAKVMQPLFFAREDTRTPLRFAVFSLIINAAIALSLAPVIGWAAAALGTTLASWGMVFLLWRGVRRMGDIGRLDKRARGRAWRILLSAAMMGFVLWFLLLALGPILSGPLSSVGLLILVLAGMLSYFGFAILTRAASLSDLKGAVRRQR